MNGNQQKIYEIDGSGSEIGEPTETESGLISENYFLL